MLKIKNLTKIYTSRGGRKVVALDDVSISFPEKGLVFLLGKSGSGKSTLLNVAGGLDAPTSGEIIFRGRSSKNFADSDYDSYRNTHVGFVFQEYNLIDSYKVGANIGLALELQGKEATREAVDKILREVGLADSRGNTFYDRLTNELSGGQKQRVAIARALIKNPQVILADEPTGAIDSTTGQQLYELLKELSKEKLIIVVTHDNENAEKYGDRIIELADGKIIGDTAPASAADETPAAAAGGSFIASKLPLSRSFTMGASGLKHKPLRLAISIILAVVAFVFFGFSVTAGFADKFTAELQTMRDKEMYMVTIEGGSYYNKGSQYESYINKLSEKQLKQIKDFNNGAELMRFTYIGDYINHPMLAYSETVLEDYVDVGNNEDRMMAQNNPYLDVGLNRSYFSSLELDPVTGAADANLKPVTTNSRLPQTFDEIAITDLKADMFVRFGYLADDGTHINISKPDDLIGKKIGSFTITGVYSTEQDLEFFKKYDMEYYDMYSNEQLRLEYYASRESIISCQFVCKGFAEAKRVIDIDNITKVLVRLSGDMGKDKEFIRALSYDEKAGDNTYSYSVRLGSQFSYLVSSADIFIRFAFVPLIISTVFAAFAALLLLNFMTVSIDFKKKELGILRALGARRKDVLTVCLMESFLVAGIDFVLSLIAVIITCLLFNASFALAIFNVGILQVLMLFLVCFGIATLATIFPVLRIANRKPIDIINDK